VNKDHEAATVEKESDAPQLALGAVLRRLRKERDLNQVDVAQRIGTDSGNISRYETDKQKPSAEMLARMAAVLGTSVSSIFRMAEKLQGQPLNDLEGYVLIPRLNLPVTAGPGVTPGTVEVQDALAFQKSWLQKKCLDADRLEIYNATGQSMVPFINPGDVLLVDRAAPASRDEEVWVLYQDAPLGVRVKRLVYRENGDLIIRSDNADKTRYPDEIVGAEAIAAVRMIGKVVWRGG